MYRLRKLYPPYGTKEMPIMESSYSEGLIKVIDGRCCVKNRDTRDRLLKLGYEDVNFKPKQTPDSKAEQSKQKTTKKR